MKIKTDNYLGLIFKVTPEFKRSIREYHMRPETWAAWWGEDEIKIREEIIDSLLDDKKYKDYLITDKVKEIASNIKITDKFNYKLLNTINQQASTYLLDRSSFFRFEAKGDNIYILYVNYNWSATYLKYETFRINTQEGELYGASEQTQELAYELIRMIIFVCMSEVDVLFLPPNKKVGTKKMGAYKNEAAIPVTVVDSHWNKFVIRTESFGVKGHLRLQACGPGHIDRKLIWIEAFEKQGYTRKPKS